MKADNRDFRFSWFNTLVVAVVIGLLAVVAAKAENNFNFDLISGLFTPTQSERFFQAGREDFEREVAIFNHPELYLRDDLLQISPAIAEQMDLFSKSGNFNLDKAEYELYLDRQ